MCGFYIASHLPGVAHRACNELNMWEKPVAVHISGIHGMRLFAAEDVIMGELVVNYTGECFLAKDANAHQ